MNTKLEMNSPTKSKINTTAILAVLLNGVMAMGWLPQQLIDMFNEMEPAQLLAFLGAINSLLYVAIGIFRTWFTDPRL